MEIEIQKDNNSSNEENAKNLDEGLPFKGKRDKPGYKKKKKTKIGMKCINPLVFIIILLLISVFFIFIFFQFAIESRINNINDTFNQRNNRKVDYTQPDKELFNSNNILKNNSEIKMNETQENVRIPIIEDIKNEDKNPLGFTIDSTSNEILGENATNKKITLAFLYSTLSANGIGRVITVTAKYLIKTGKYNLIFITEKPYNREFSYDKSIKRFYCYNNYTLLRNLSKYEKIDIVVLQNVCSKSVVKFHHNLGQKVICMFHGIFMSAMYGNHVTSYKNWEQFDSCDSYIFIGPDDYYFYKKLNYNNSMFMPNLYTYDPHEIASSNLTNHNIVILGRLNDWIKGVKFAIKAMQYIIKEVPDAMLYLVSSDSRTQYLKNLTRDLNLTKNIIFKGGTFNLTQLFYNSSVHMYTSLSEAFPMALVEGKAHGMPVVGFEVPYSLPYQQGFIGVELFDVKGLARETIKLLKDYEYRKRKGEEAKRSLDVVKNNETVELWGRLCDSLLSNDREDYRKLQREMENKYYNETRARQHLESHYNILLRYNFNLSCHSFDSFTNFTYLKNISKCNMTEIHENVTYINIFNRDP